MKKNLIKHYLKELENENVLESNVTLNSEENLSKPLVRKRILK